jgi:hypothetical protein
MANAKLALGASKLLAGPLGVVGIAFKGYHLGKTTSATELMPDQDIQDINYQQDGTKPADKVRTGIMYSLSCQFGEIKTSLISLLMSGFRSNNTDPDSDSAFVGRSLYQSMRDNEAGPLKVFAQTADGVDSTDLMDIIHCYEVIANIDGAMINWGADTQRNLSVKFDIYYHTFEEGEATEVDGITEPGGFFYYGDPADYGVPAIDWPDVGAPEIVSVIATDDDEVVITFDKNIEFVTAFAAKDYVLNVNGAAFSNPTAGSILLKVLTLTFAASTILTADKGWLSISNDTLQTTDVVAIAFPGVLNKHVTNNVPEPT